MKLWFKFLIIAAIVIWAAVLTLPDNNLHVVFCDVGQGDATLIFRGTDQLLIDGGPDDKVLECLSNHMPFYDRRIETVILTHDNADHSKGLAYVRDRYTVLYFEPKLRSGDRVKMGSLIYEVEWPDQQVLGVNTTTADNDLGIVGELKYGSFKVLMTADVAVKNYLPETGLAIIKIPHHGSLTGITADWISGARPQMAVISVGKGNRFGHPAPEVIKILSDAKIKIKRTDLDGEVEVVSDGKRWWVN